MGPRPHLCGRAAGLCHEPRLRDFCKSLLRIPKIFKTKMVRAIRNPPPRGDPHGAPAPFVWESGGALPRTPLKGLLQKSLENPQNL